MDQLFSDIKIQENSNTVVEENQNFIKVNFFEFQNKDQPRQLQ